MSKEPVWKSLKFPEVNSRWDMIGGFRRTARVMGVVEGYVVARNTGASPFLVHMSDWYGRYELKIMQRKGKATTTDASTKGDGK